MGGEVLLKRWAQIFLQKILNEGVCPGINKKVQRFGSEFYFGG